MHVVSAEVGEPSGQWFFDGGGGVVYYQHGKFQIARCCTFGRNEHRNHMRIPRVSVINRFLMLNCFCWQAEQLCPGGRHYLLQNWLPETGACKEHADLNLNYLWATRCCNKLLLALDSCHPVPLPVCNFMCNKKGYWCSVIVRNYLLCIKVDVGFSCWISYH